MSKESFEVTADKDGKFYKKKVIKDDSWTCINVTLNVKFNGKLVKQKDASIKASLTADKKKLDFEAATGKSVTIGRFPINKCDAVIELRGVSDKPGEAHLIEVERKLA
jgi:hypothetical protein